MQSIGSGFLFRGIRGEGLNTNERAVSAGTSTVCKAVNLERQAVAGFSFSTCFLTHNVFLVWLISGIKVELRRKKLPKMLQTHYCIYSAIQCQGRLKAIYGPHFIRGPNSTIIPHLEESQEGGDVSSFIYSLGHFLT